MTETPQLERTLTLRGAVTLNLLDMIGVGPFLTLPLLMGAMGGPQAMLGWLLGALLAVCDGLVWAELGAAMPEAGGSYRYLAAMYPGRWGRWLSFLYVFQLCLSAPLSIASGSIGLAQYAGFFVPGLATPQAVHALHVGGYSFGFGVGWATLLAMATVGTAVMLQYRRLRAVETIAQWMLVFVLAAMVMAFVTGVLRGHWAHVLAIPTVGVHLGPQFFSGLGAAMLVATYDYWGYYNVTFLGGEVREPERTIPRALLISIGVVAALYVALNASVLAVMPAAELVGMKDVGVRRALLGHMMQVAWSPALGAAAGLWLGRAAALLVMVTAFASVFSLLLGYSRIPYAAAKDGNFPQVFARLHARGGFPYVALLALAGVACVCCLFSLADVIAALVVVRILLQFGLQHVGVILLRLRRPEMARPFRMWLYPLPPLAALVGFGYIVFSRANFSREIVLAAAVFVAGTVVYLLREAASKHGTTA